MTLQETTMEDRLALLERRLASLEDEREIVQLLTTYGALADSGSSAEVAAIWTEDGVYDNDVISMTGRDQIVAMIESAAHQGYIARGCAHFNGPVSVHVDGDTAVAVSQGDPHRLARGTSTAKQSRGPGQLQHRSDDLAQRLHRPF